MRKKRISIGILLALIALTAALTLSLTYEYTLRRFNAQIKNLTEREQTYAKISQIDAKVRDKFYFPIDENQLNDAVAKGYVSGLGDAYSAYLPTEEAELTLKTLEGKSVGLGIEVYYGDDGGIYVTRVHAGTPAAIAGIRKGDCILSVDGHNTAEETYSKMRTYLDGEAETEALLEIQRMGEAEPLSFSVMRKEFSVETVTYRVVNHAIGYIRIHSFTERTPEEFNAALNALVKAGVTGMIFDVRDNVGGVLESVAEVLDAVMPSCNLISVEYRSGVKKTLYTSDAAKLELPVMVLVNENSASGAELFASVIQDYGKGKIVGMQTYGKGTMQDYYTFTDGSALRLTVGKFYSPFGNNFDEIGVTPDIQIAQTPEALQNPYFLTDAEDTQLSTAISALITAGSDVSTDVDIPDPESETESQAEDAASETEKNAGVKTTAYASELSRTTLY